MLQVLEKFTIFCKIAIRVIGIDIFTIRFDRKSDLLYEVLGEYLSKKNIHVDVANLSLTNNKEMAEIRNIKLIEMVKLIFQHTALPISFEGYALQIVSNLSN